MGHVISNRGRAHRGARIAALAAALLVVAGCGATVAPTPATPAPTPTSTPLAPPPTKNPVPLPATQTDTEWGRIWDALPASFPTPPGARPTQTGEGPASAILDVPGDATTTMTDLQAALELAGLDTQSLSGPLEDGSRILESLGAGACRVQARVALLGGTTVLTVLYGAACPFS